MQRFARLETANLGAGNSTTRPKKLERVIAQIAERLRTRPAGTLPEFLVYAPENSALRTFQAEGQILPLGIRGEGLFAHLKGLDSEMHRDRLERIRETLKLIDWFETFVIPENLSPGERTIKIQDRYLSDGTLFDQRRRKRGIPLSPLLHHARDQPGNASLLLDRQRRYLPQPQAVHRPVTTVRHTREGI